MWATRRVGSLLEAIKLDQAQDNNVDEALALARRYGVVTEFTFFEVNEEGDTHMVYSPVPMAATGAVAVQTSSSLDSYQKGGTVGASVDQFVRYAGDRTLPIQQGWFWDTSADTDDPWVIVHFASALYFEILSAETEWGIDQYFSVSPNVRFEFLGRNFRITHPKSPTSPILGGSESEAFPAPTSTPVVEETWVLPIDLTDEPRPVHTGRPGAPTTHKPTNVIVLHGKSNRAHCTVGAQPSNSSLAMLGILFALLIGVRRKTIYGRP